MGVSLIQPLICNARLSRYRHVERQDVIVLEHKGVSSNLMRCEEIRRLDGRHSLSFDYVDGLQPMKRGAIINLMALPLEGLGALASSVLLVSWHEKKGPV